MISVVIPTFNEESSGTLKITLERLSPSTDIELIVADRGSTDATLKIAESFNCKILNIKSHARAASLNAGFLEASHNLVLLHHPRSLLDTHAISQLLMLKDQMVWGGFTHKFDHAHFLYKFTSWYSNEIRAKLRGIVYLDHCIFLNKKLITYGPLMPEVDIFEDTELSLKLRKLSPPLILPAYSTTSAIRFEKNGFFKQALKNQYLKWLFYFSRSHVKMNKHYEKGLNLNSDYDK